MKELKQMNPDHILWYDIETAPLTTELLKNPELFDVWDYIKNKKGSTLMKS